MFCSTNRHTEWLRAAASGYRVEPKLQSQEQTHKKLWNQLEAAAAAVEAQRESSPRWSKRSLNESNIYCWFISKRQVTPEEIREEVQVGYRTCWSVESTVCSFHFRIGCCDTCSTPGVLGPKESSGTAGPAAGSLIMQTNIQFFSSVLIHFGVVCSASVSVFLFRGFCLTEPVQFLSGSILTLFCSQRFKKQNNNPAEAPPTDQSAVAKKRWSHPESVTSHNISVKLQV